MRACRLARCRLSSELLLCGTQLWKQNAYDGYDDHGGKGREVVIPSAYLLVAVRYLPGAAWPGKQDGHLRPFFESFVKMLKTSRRSPIKCTMKGIGAE